MALVYRRIFSNTVCTSPENQHCLGGGEGECFMQIKNVHSVPGLLASIVHSFVLLPTDNKIIVNSDCVQAVLVDVENEPVMFFKTRTFISDGIW